MLPNCLPQTEGLVQSPGISTVVGLEFMSFHMLGSAVSVDFSIIILSSLAPMFPPPSHCLDSWSLAWFLVLDLCLFHQLLDEGSMMIVGVYINLITEGGQFRILFTIARSLSWDLPCGFLGVP